MVAPLILIGIVIIYFIVVLAVTYWYITITIIIIIAVLLYYGTRDSNKKEERDHSRREYSDSYQNYSQSDYEESDHSRREYSDSYQNYSQSDYEESDHSRKNHSDSYQNYSQEDSYQKSKGKSKSKSKSKSRRSQSSSYENYSQSDYSNEGTDGYGQSYQKKSYQKKSYQKKIDEKKSYHYDGYEHKKIGKPKLSRINERLEKFQITPEEARIIFGNAWTTKLGLKNRISFYFMIRGIEVKLEYDDYNRYKKKLRHLYSKLLEIIQIVMDEHEDLREKEKRWSEGDYSYDYGYDYQNYDDSSEVTEKKITQSFQIFGLTHNSTLEQIKEKYRELSLKYHPDRNKNTDTTTKMSEINSAYEIIMGAIT